MKYLQMGFLAFLFVFALNFVTTGSSLVSADDDYEEKYEHNGEGNEYGENDDGGPYEDLGDTAGWGTVIAMGAAAVIFPVRRSMKTVITNFPGAKNIFIFFSRFLGKYHIFIGVSAFALSIVHGVTMYLSEGELESEGLIGLVAVGFMAVAGILGGVMAKNKKSKSLRTTHTILIAIAILIGIVHILAS